MHTLLRCTKLPTWPMLQAVAVAVAVACGGDEEFFRSLWGRAWQAANPDVRIEHPEHEAGPGGKWAAARTNIGRTARLVLRLASRDGELPVMQWMCTRDALRVAQILDAVAVSSAPVVTATIAGLDDAGLIALHSAIRRPNQFRVSR